MKVMLVNGSPHKKGCTNRALEEVASTLKGEGIDSQVFWIGKDVPGCRGCYRCYLTGRCAIKDSVNEFRPLAREADGFVFGAPVHFGHAGASMLGFMDRLFFSDGHTSCGEPPALVHKPAAAVTSSRRAGTTSALEDMEKFFTISQMPVVGSSYWNMVHGMTAKDAEQDEEGMATMRQLGHDMAWTLRSIEVGRAAGVQPPEQEDRVRTSFIRKT